MKRTPVTGYKVFVYKNPSKLISLKFSLSLPMASPVYIIGAGLGGSSAAIHLAMQGQEVIVLEKNQQAGGKLDEYQHEGFRFDTGPSLLTLRFILEDIFQLAGKNINDYLTLQELDPICRYFYTDGTCIDAHSDIEKMRKNMPAALHKDADVLPAYFAYSKKIYDLTAQLFLFGSIQDIRHLWNPQAWKTLFKINQIDPFRTVHQANQAWFHTPHLQQIFDRYATYNGSDPWQAPATLNQIPHVEYALKSWYVKGGIYRIAEALVNLAIECGVKFKYNTEITQILHHRKKITALRTSLNEILPAENIICNADLVYTFDKLIEGFPQKTEKLNRAEPSCSGLVFLWNMHKSWPQLAHHNILFSDNYEQEFRQIFRELKAPDDPTVYISITQKSDPTHAPEGCENWFVLVNMPWLNKADLPEQEDIQKIKNAIIQRAEKSGLGDIRPYIVSEKIISPADLKNRTYSNKGSIYGLSSNNRNAAFNRQDNRSRDLKGLYFAGGSVHPGGGMPLVLLSGKNAAKLLLQDLK